MTTDGPTFEELLDAANAGEHPRLPGQWTPTACRVWREADPEMARLLEAALALELTTGQRVQAYEEVEVRERRRMMDEATAAQLSFHSNASAMTSHFDRR